MTGRMSSRTCCTKLNFEFPSVRSLSFIATQIYLDCYHSIILPPCFSIHALPRGLFHQYFSIQVFPSLISVEVQCVGHEHFPIVSLDEVFHMSCDQIYKLLFTDSDFIHRFNSSRKTSGRESNDLIL